VGNSKGSGLAFCQDRRSPRYGKKQDLAAIRVLHLISTLDVGGAEQNLHRLLKSMDKNAFQNEVICMTQPGAMAHKIEETGIPVHSLKMKKGIPDVRAVLRLRFIANLMRPDIIQCWMYHANLLGLMMLRPKATLWNIRCSDMDLSFYPPVYRWSVKTGAILSHIPEAVVANSHAGRKAHEELGYRPKRWAIIPNGFDTDLFKPDANARSRIRAELKIPEDILAIGLIGRLDPMKDHATFFEAANLFLGLRPNTHFILAGRGVTGENTKIREMLRPSGDNEQFHLLDERGDIEHILASLDIAASSSVSEGSPNAIGEAMACGIPCVATDVGDTRLLMGDTGIVVNKRSPRELCEAWDYLVRSGTDERHEMGIKARERIMQHYTLKQSTETYESLYREIINGRTC
jgi:glycosyltransferase involved in cell wall biosynthesis